MVKQVRVTYMETVRKAEEVEVPAGDKTVEIILPDAVPAGKKLVLTIEVRGEMQDA